MEIFERRNPLEWEGLEIGIWTNRRRFRRREVTKELSPSFIKCPIGKKISNWGLAISESDKED